jgi:hypothetical protein
MTTAELWFLIILALKLSSDAIEKINIALLWVLLQSRDEGP